MKELEFLEIINKTLSDNSYLGDDCALLDDLGIYVTQDTLVEDVHFSLKYATPFQIGAKAVCVNLSDLASNLAEPKYLTVSLSMPKNTTSDFVEEIYKGINEVCEEYDVKVIGGDITRADKVVISICAIGKKVCKFNANRKSAKVGDFIVVTGDLGSSSAGLKCLFENINNEHLKSAHISVIPRIKEAKILSENISRDIACMDTSDGLYDALNKLAEASNISINLDFNAVPFNSEIKLFDDYKDLILFGGEDFELICCLSESDYLKLDKNKFIKIGEVIKKTDQSINILQQTFDFQNSKTLFEHFD